MWLRKLVTPRRSPATYIYEGGLRIPDIPGKPPKGKRYVEPHQSYINHGAVPAVKPLPEHIRAGLAAIVYPRKENEDAEYVAGSGPAAA